MAAACSHTGVARTRLPAVALLALAALLGAGPPAKRQDPRDLQLTIYARRALLGDKDLAPLNVFVRVEEGVATLSGPVPSREMAEHAVAVVKKVEGIREVRNDLSVVPPRAEQALGSLLAGLGVLPGLPSGPAAGLDDRGSVPGAALAKEAPPPEVFSAHPDVAPPRPAAPRGPTVSLGAPVAIAPDRAPGPATLRAPRAEAPGRPVARSAEDFPALRASVERISPAPRRR